jgi:hypothetical protein
VRLWEERLRKRLAGEERLKRSLVPKSEKTGEQVRRVVLRTGEREEEMRWRPEQLRNCTGSEKMRTREREARSRNHFRGTGRVVSGK